MPDYLHKIAEKFTAAHKLDSSMYLIVPLEWSDWMIDWLFQYWDMDPPSGQLVITLLLPPITKEIPN
jgi:hypothetical protein